ncbi:MAG: ATP-dependent DNA ligase, partial [Nanoarchaeota archaeon]
KFKEFVELLEKLESTTKRLKKTWFIHKFLKEKVKDDEDYEYIVRILTGQLFFPWEERIIGIKDKLIIRALAQLIGIDTSKIEEYYKKYGDLGEVAQIVLSKRKIQTFFKKELTLKDLFKKIYELSELEGEGSLDKKLLVLKSLFVNSEPKEAKYIVKILLNELRVGVAEGIIRDALAWTFLPKPAGVFAYCRKCHNIVFNQEKCLNCDFPIDNEFNHQVALFEKLFNPKVIDFKDEKELEEKLKETIYEEVIIVSTQEKAYQFYNYELDKLEFAYAKLVDYGEIAKRLKEDRANLFKIKIKLFRPIKVMLAQKVNNIKEGFETVGKPALVEYKYDGFRAQIHNKEGEIRIFTRKLEEVTKQFPDLVELAKKYIKAKNYIVEGEVIAFKDKPLPFQVLSRRIKRKYNINEMVKEIPIQANLFDIVYLEDELLDLPLEERRKRLESIVESTERIKTADKLVSDNEEEVKKFYNKALAEGHEGIMMKNLKAPYRPGKRVGYMVKLKPTLENLDLVIVAAEWGEGKRSGWLTSYYVAAFDEKTQKLVEVGKVSTGVKEKDQTGVTYEELTNLLKPLIEKEEGKKVYVQPKIVVEVAYEEIQESPKYESGFALRFPRIVRLRLDKGVEDIDSIERIKRIAELQKREKVERELGIIDY